MPILKDDTRPAGRATDTIEELFCWVAVHPNGVEGIVSTQLDGTHMPLVGSSRETMEKMRPVVAQLRQQTGYPIKLLRFKGRREVTTL